MQTIGFTSEYYTLWNVSEPYEEPVYYNGMKIGSVTKRNVNYVQNLSKDLEKAKAKLTGEYRIDLEQRGHSSYTMVVSSNIKNRDEYYPKDCFSFGKLEGQKFSDVDDVWQLDRAYTQEPSARRRVNARRRLIELGELVKYTWIDTIRKNMNWGIHDENGHCLPEDVQDIPVKRSYATPKHIASLELEKELAFFKKGLHFEDGQKVELEIKRLDAFSFKGQYGTTYVITYGSKCGKTLKYMGSSPADIDTDYVKVTATIKHSNYNNEEETKLIRIKVIK